MIFIKPSVRDVFVCKAQDFWLCVFMIHLIHFVLVLFFFFRIKIANLREIQVVWKLFKPQFILVNQIFLPLCLFVDVVIIISESIGYMNYNNPAVTAYITQKLMYSAQFIERLLTL